ncbi:hypothetical protein [Streptomyces sp. NPDC048638]|uniref:hypothetical protein n=1 Tax=Streptomyces sp. NPDC048638 TaxID=3365580 RepID=UPI00371CBF17
MDAARGAQKDYAEALRLGKKGGENLSNDELARLGSRLARENDHRPDISASRVYWASIANMTRRLTTPAPTWRDPLGLAA